MDKFMSNWSAVVVILVSLCAVGCDKSESEPIVTEQDEFVVDSLGRRVYCCELNLDGQVQGFDGATAKGVGTRATSGWVDGDCIYLLFNSGDEKVEGQAIYSESDGKWTLYYYGQLFATTSGNCIAYYFDGKVTQISQNTKLSIPPTTAIYYASKATFSKEGRNVSVTVSLEPLTGRLMFTGEKGYKFTVSGLEYYNGYVLATGALTTAQLYETITIDNSGQTSYLHGYFPADTPHTLKVYTNNDVFETVCEDDVLAGTSTGYILAPTTTMHNGWKRTKR